MYPCSMRSCVIIIAFATGCAVPAYTKPTPRQFPATRLKYNVSAVDSARALEVSERAPAKEEPPPVAFCSSSALAIFDSRLFRMSS